MSDYAIFTRSIHCLQHDKHRICVLSIEHILVLCQSFDVFAKFDGSFIIVPPGKKISLKNYDPGFTSH